MTDQVSSNYAEILAGLKQRIRTARQKAILAVNAQLIAIYYEIGKIIIQQQAEEGWGTKVIERLAKDLRTEFPDMKGFSVRNIKYMRAFADAWPEAKFMQQAAAQLQNLDIHDSEKVQHLVAQIPWGHHQLLLDKVKTVSERNFYLIQTIENGWSRSILSRQIDTGLYHRQGQTISNFASTLPTPISDLAQETFNNPYVLEFVGLSEKMQELQLEKALIKHMQEFLLELGRGFSYVGRQKNIVVDGDDFFLDLLFFNFQLNCFVIFELKVGEFKPEFAGKLNFYVNTVNQQLRGPDHKPTIGVLLCKTPNKTVIEYSLQGIKSPIGVSEYEFVKTLPKEFKGGIPTVEELEAEIEREIEDLKSPLEKRLDVLKQKIASTQIEQVSTTATLEILFQLFDKSLLPLYRELLQRLSVFHDLFLNYSYAWLELPEAKNIDQLPPLWKDEVYLKGRNVTNFLYRLNGFKAGGVDTFDIVSQLVFAINQYNYGFSLSNYNNNQPFLKRVYHQQLSVADIKAICDVVVGNILLRLEDKMDD
jgi:predicted nuclease of restriction endonuclease-like (RecB) superfamily